MCAKRGDVLEYAVAKRNVTAWVADRFRQTGARAEPDACAALVQLVGDDLRALAIEVDKLATWAGDEPITEREVEQLVAPVAETPSFAITDSWAAHDRSRALEIERANLRSLGPDEEGRGSASFGDARRACGAAERRPVAPRERRASQRTRSRELGTRSSFYAEKLYRQSDEFSSAELGRQSSRLAALDLSLKGGSRLAPDLELQRALLDLSREPGANVPR